MIVPKPRKQAKPRRQATIAGQPVTIGKLRDYVLIRDGGCVLRERHVCRGRDSLEHVVGVHGHLDVRRDDDRHTVGLCLGSNIDHTTKPERAWIREYLTARFPECVSSTRGGDG